jgi:hypothetical protein
VKQLHTESLAASFMQLSLKAAILAMLVLLFTACLSGGGGSAAGGSTTIADLQPIEAVPTTTTTTSTTTSTTTTTVPAPSFASLAGHYTNAAYTLDILADGSFSASTNQLYVITTRSNGSTNDTAYSCSVTGTMLSVFSSSGSFTTYNVSLSASDYYKPTPNNVTYAYSNYGCLGSASPSTIGIEVVSATCLRVQDLGYNTASPSNTGLTYCK